MPPPGAFQDLAAERVVVIMRGDHRPDDVSAMAEILLAAGLRVVEVTMNSRHSEACLRRLARVDGLQVGAGTVMDVDDLDRALDTGAQFVVTPHTDVALIQAARERRAPIVPGALTPTEVLAAWTAGAYAVKLFPAYPGGPEYMRALRGPLDNVPLIPTGGIDDSNAAAFLGAGAFAIAVGAWLVPASRADVDLQLVGERAHSLLASMQSSSGVAS